MWLFRKRPFIVSLGGTCTVKYQIQQWVPELSNGERFFFDYVESSFKSVLQLFRGDADFGCKCDGEFEYATGKTGKHTARMVMDCGPVSIHDIEYGYSDAEFDGFIASLKRRCMRSMSVLYMNRPVFMVHLAHDNKPLTKEQIDECLSLWSKVNVNHMCVLVDCYDSTQFQAEPFSHTRLIRFPFKHVKSTKSSNWKKDEFNWKDLFALLKKYKVVKPKNKSKHDGIV